MNTIKKNKLVTIFVIIKAKLFINIIFFISENVLLKNTFNKYFYLSPDLYGGMLLVSTYYRFLVFILYSLTGMEHTEEK